jgi:hypothetical protein
VTPRGLNLDFLSLSGDLEKKLQPQAQALLGRLLKSWPREQGCRGFENLGAETSRLLKQAAAIPDDTMRTTLSRALIARLASTAAGVIAGKPVTAAVVKRAEDWLPTLFTYLNGDDHQDYWYPNDLFLKDYRFVTGLTVPCGAQVVDLWDGIGPKTAFKLGLKHPSLFLRALRRPWFQIHTEGRYLAEFNDPGWRAFYKLAVDLLLLNKHIEGIVGTSWFYDPALSDVSPRLSYLRDYPLQHGAVSVRQGTTAFDIKSATATSESRRKLFEQGRYTPVCHTIIWPREAMIDWASRYSA